MFRQYQPERLMSNLTMHKRVMEQFLKSGFIFKGELLLIETDSPRGGVYQASLQIQH